MRSSDAACTHHVQAVLTYHHTEPQESWEWDHASPQRALSSHTHLLQPRRPSVLATQRPLHPALRPRRAKAASPSAPPPHVPAAPAAHLLTDARRSARRVALRSRDALFFWRRASNWSAMVFSRTFSAFCLCTASISTRLFLKTLPLTCATHVDARCGVRQRPNGQPAMQGQAHAASTPTHPARTFSARSTSMPELRSRLAAFLPCGFALCSRMQDCTHMMS